MIPQVCVSISASAVPELLAKAERAERLRADLIEVRLDALRSYHGLSRLAKSVETPLIAANRSISEKGSYEGKESERLRILEEAIEAGFQYADLEVTTKSLPRATSKLRQKGARIILSHHDHLRTPKVSHLNGILAELQNQKPNFSKVVTTANLPNDNLAILEFLQKNHRNSAVVGFAMGEAGVWSRLLAPFYGSAFTYASLSKGMETAPGQLTISEMRSIYETLSLG